MVEGSVILEDDWSYLAVTDPGRLATTGAICVLEFGDGEAEVPSLLPLDVTGTEALVAALQQALTLARAVRH